MSLISRYKKYRKSTILIILLLGLFVVSVSSALATSVSRNSIVNLEGYSGKTIKTEIILEGTDLMDKSGYWYTHYKEEEGDDDRMDITSWITVEPTDFTVKQGEKKSFYS